MGLIAVHRPSGVATRNVPGEDGLTREMAAAGVQGGQWVVLHTRIRAQAGRFVAPPRPDDAGIGTRVPDPLGWWTKRSYPVDDHPVGVQRV